MELRQLRYFVTVAETLNFRRAAEQLNMAQPPLSVAIRHLEEEVGAKLFERKNRRVLLTEAGRAALSEARKCLHQATETARVARAASAGETGLVRLAFAGSATYSLLPTLLPIYRARHPRVMLELREGTNTQILSLLEHQEIDLGIVRVPTALPPRFEVTTVEHDVLVAALPVDHPLARKPRLAMADLADQPLVNHASSGHVGGLKAATAALFQQAGIQPRIEQEAVQIHTIISLVASGLGIALVPSVSGRYASDRVVYRRIEDAPAAASVGLAIAYDPARENSAARKFLVAALETTRGRA